jgi:hypothetical protein
VIIKRHIRHVLVAFGASIGLLALAPLTAVYAATVDGGPVATPPNAAGISGTTPKPVAEVTQEGPVVTSTDSAGNPCATRSFEIDLVEQPLGWPTDAWYKMTTHWCWNGRIVTSHNTYQTYGITTVGSLEGWEYDGETSGWWCYVASGSTRSCSGNTEWAQGHFKAVQYNIQIGSWSPFIQEWENYHGGFLHN